MSEATPKVLIVEDNSMNLELAKDLLEACGIEVISASSGESALKLAQDQRPDLILMDLSLPGMDGLQATAALKRAPKTRMIPIVAVTAHAMKGDEERALAAGCEGYITKPIDTRMFPTLVAEYLRRAA